MHKVDTLCCKTFMNGAVKKLIQGETFSFNSPANIDVDLAL